MQNENKYLRKIIGLDGRTAEVDVYAVLDAFNVVCPARQHAIKKLLCAGLRGKGDSIQDLKETYQAMERAIGLETQRQYSPPSKPEAPLSPSLMPDGVTVEGLARIFDRGQLIGGTSESGILAVLRELGLGAHVPTAKEGGVVMGIKREFS